MKRPSFIYVAPFLLVVFFGLAFRHYTPAYAQSTASSASLQGQIDSNDAQIAQLNAQIAQYEAELTAIGANKTTLQSAINSLNVQKSKLQTQVNVIQTQINTTKLQIQQLGQTITSTQQSIADNQSAIGEDMRSLQEAGDEPLIVQAFSAGSLTNAWDSIDATLQLQNAIEAKVQTLQTQETSLAASQAASKQKQTTLTTQEQSLASQQVAVVQTTKSKTQLLAQTNASEATYEQLLAAAKAQLAGFSTFTQSAGGSGLLTNQTSCDAWGCYYNQRDAQWGNDALDGTQYQLKSDGCLITAMAMVMTHYGYSNVTPVTINSNPNNFAAYYPAYLLFTINVAGVSATRKTATIDAVLATGNPVIIGLNAYGGTHYVVFVSGSNGNYVMRDPYIPNGKDISFTAHYSLKDIFGIAKVVISS